MLTQKHRAGSDVAERVAHTQATIEDLADSEADYALRVVGIRRQARELRDALTARGITMARFAQECGCSPSNISSYLSPTTLYGLPVYIWRTAERMGLV